MIGKSGTISALKFALGGLVQRHEATAANIANAETPGYTPLRVDFESRLAQRIREAGGSSPLELRRTSDRHLPSSGADELEASTHERGALVQRIDGGKVDIEQETVLMADTSIRQAAIVAFIGAHYRQLRSAITEGRK